MGSGSGLLTPGGKPSAPNAATYAACSASASRSSFCKRQSIFPHSLVCCRVGGGSGGAFLMSSAAFRRSALLRGSPTGSALSSASRASRICWRAVLPSPPGVARSLSSMAFWAALSANFNWSLLFMCCGTVSISRGSTLGFSGAGRSSKSNSPPASHAASSARSRATASRHLRISCKASSAAFPPPGRCCWRAAAFCSIGAQATATASLSLPMGQASLCPSSSAISATLP
mmetsp:Transcript_44609/g.100973  ORF Transcript_44609/g.100973 Transcript_44609/m.100973 type:complete len:230 (+) Transcript_44609:669-1358(+)